MDTVRAAGGIIWRETVDGPRVVVIHRPAYDDWSFPKGKLDPGENEATAALRESTEETSLTCTLSEDLGVVSYTDGKGRPKTVRYWRMEAEAPDTLAADNEVDEARWVSLDEAMTLLTYTHDRTLLQRCAARFS